MYYAVGLYLVKTEFKNTLANIMTDIQMESFYDKMILMRQHVHAPCYLVDIYGHVTQVALLPKNTI